MNCDQIQSRILYEAEDDPGARALLDEHLAGCSDCAKSSAEYQALTVLCKEESRGLPAPSFRPVEHSAAGWRWIRAAAVVAFALLGSMFIPHNPVKTNPPAKQPVPTWEFSVPASILSSPDQESLNFQIQINSLHDQILEMRSRNAANQF